MAFSSNYSSHTLIPAFTNTYLYDSSSDGNYTVYPGLLFAVIDSQGFEKKGYDARERIIATARYLNINTNTYTTGYTFDDGDNITSITYPNPGPTITNTYFHGKSINLTSLSGSTGNNYYTVSASGYDQFGHVTNFAYGNGLTTTRGYYSVSKRLQSISAGSGGAVFNRNYQYTAGDDITNISGVGLPGAMSVSYYNLHRLKSYGGSTNNYGYDPTGNLTTNSEGGGSKYTYANPRIQAVLTAFGYTNLYDLCGNMMVRHGGLTNSQALVYDAKNRLSAVAQAGVMSDEFGYAYDDARLWKRINQNSTNIQVWIGNIYEQKGGKILFHVYAGSEQVCSFEATSSLNGGSNTNAVGYYYHQDNLNTSSALSGSGGSQAELNVYYPFGRIQTAAPQAGFQVSRRFTGQVFDAESGLYYYNARYYDPELGRFTQPNTVIQDLANPQSYNRYSYCGNNPLRYTDPTGKDFVINAGVINGPYAYMTAKSTLGQIGASFYNAIPLVDNSIYQILRPVNAAFDVAGDATHDAVLITTGDPQLADNSRNLPWLLGGELGMFGKADKVDEVLAGTLDDTGAITKPDYSSIPDPKNVKVGGDFTAAQKADALEVNKTANNGVVRSDGDGRALQKPEKSQRGVTPSPNEWQFDHKIPKAKGGDNSSKNINLLSREENRAKSDKVVK